MPPSGDEKVEGAARPVPSEGASEAAEPDDAALMIALKAGQMAALGVLYRRHGGTVRAAVRRFAPEIPAAEEEELGQDVFLEVARCAGRYREDRRFKAWLYAIAVNRARRWRRSTWARRRILSLNRGTPVAIAPAVEGGPGMEVEVKSQLSDALEALSPGQRQVILLHSVEGFSGEEIAEILGVRLATVWTRLHRARKKIAQRLAEEGEDRLEGLDE